MSDSKSHFKYLDNFKGPSHFIKYQIAKRMTNFYSPSLFIGVSGSVGKSTSLDLARHLLSSKFETISTSDDGEYLLNLSQTLIKLRPSTKKALLELPIYKSTDVESILSMVRPFCLVVTNVSYDNLENFGSLDHLLSHYRKLLQSLPEDGYAILNYDDLHTRQLAEGLNCQVAFFGTDKQNCHIYASNIKVNKFSTQFEINYGVERAEIALPWVGRQYVYSSLAAASIGIISKMSLFAIQKVLQKIPTLEGGLLEGVAGWTVIDESSHISTLSLQLALELLNELPARRRILVMSDIRGLGAVSEKIHRQIAQTIFKDRSADLVLLTGEESKYVADELLNLGYLPEQVEFISSNNQIVNRILTSASSGDLILVKGHKAAKFSEVVQRITKPK